MDFKLELLVVFFPALTLAVQFINEFNSDVCIQEGQTLSLLCTIEDETGNGATMWDGSNSIFNCPNFDTLFDRRIVLLHPLIKQESYVSCTNNLQARIISQNGSLYTSMLMIKTTYAMNGGEVACQSYFEHQTRVALSLLIGAVPNPPSNANLTITGSNIFRYDWDPPDIDPLGGICGYNLSYEGVCGRCFPEGLVSNTTLSSNCTEWLALGQTCHFLVTTVTADCGFHSDPANISNVLDNTAATNLMLELICSQNVICPDIRVTWEYSPPEVSNATILPDVLGFFLTLTDEFGNSFHSEFLEGSSVQEYTFNATEVETAGVNGTTANISVSVRTEVGNFSNTALISSEGVTVNTSAALSESVCLGISINSLCSVDYRDFQVEILYSELDLPCESGAATNTTGRQSLDDQYSVCIPIPPRSLCFSVAVFINGSNDRIERVGQTEEQSIQLLSCDTSSLNSGSTVVLLNSVSGVVIHSGADVEHNEMVEFGCEDSNNYYCNLIVNHKQTRCVNGTFDPRIVQVSCDCTSLPVAVIIAIVVFCIVSLLIFIFVLAPCCICIWNKVKNTATVNQQSPWPSYQSSLQSSYKSSNKSSDQSSVRSSDQSSVRSSVQSGNGPEQDSAV